MPYLTPGDDRRVGPEKVIWIKIPKTQNDGKNRVFFQLTSDTGERGFFELENNDTKLEWVKWLAESLIANNVKISYVKGSTVHKYGSPDAYGNTTTPEVPTNQHFEGSDFQRSIT